MQEVCDGSSKKSFVRSLRLPDLTLVYFTGCTGGCTRACSQAKPEYDEGKVPEHT